MRGERVRRSWCSGEGLSSERKVGGGVFKRPRTGMTVALRRCPLRGVGLAREKESDGGEN